MNLVQAYRDGHRVVALDDGRNAELCGPAERTDVGLFVGVRYDLSPGAPVVTWIHHAGTGAWIVDENEGKRLHPRVVGVVDEPLRPGTRVAQVRFGALAVAGEDGPVVERVDGLRVYTSNDRDVDGTYASSFVKRLSDGRCVFDAPGPAVTELRRLPSPTTGEGSPVRGETWYVRFRWGATLATKYVADVTERTVLLYDVDRRGEPSAADRGSRYALDDVEFVERAS